MRSQAGVLVPLTAFFALLLPLLAIGQQAEDHRGHSGHQMSIQPSGTVMNENPDRLPRDCSEISREYAFTIQAGRDYADDVPGMIFGMSEHEILVEPCSRIEVTFVNEDEVRHQWMVHGLPRYLYPAGMFHIEASGGHRQTGTLIVPGDDRTYLIHCDIAQHMEKGMRGQLVVGSGSGDLWGVPGVSGDFLRAPYLPRYAPLLAIGVLLIAFLGSLRLIRKFCH
jgi:plastocyanin